MERLLAVLFIIYQIGVPISGLVFLVDYCKKVDGVLEFIGFMILASLKALVWPVAMFM